MLGDGFIPADMEDMRPTRTSIRLLSYALLASVALGGLGGRLFRTPQRTGAPTAYVLLRELIHRLPHAGSIVNLTRRAAYAIEDCVPSPGARNRLARRAARLAVQGWEAARSLTQIGGGLEKFPWRRLSPLVEGVVRTWNPLDAISPAGRWRFRLPGAGALEVHVGGVRRNRGRLVLEKVRLRMNGFDVRIRSMELRLNILPLLLGIDDTLKVDIDLGDETPLLEKARTGGRSGGGTPGKALWRIRPAGRSALAAALIERLAGTEVEVRVHGSAIPSRLGVRWTPPRTPDGGWTLLAGAGLPSRPGDGDGGDSWLLRVQGGAGRGGRFPSAPRAELYLPLGGVHRDFAIRLERDGRLSIAPCSPAVSAARSTPRLLIRPEEAMHLLAAAAPAPLRLTFVGSDSRARPLFIRPTGGGVEVRIPVDSPAGRPVVTARTTWRELAAGAGKVEAAAPLSVLPGAGAEGRVEASLTLSWERLLDAMCLGGGAPVSPLLRSAVRNGVVHLSAASPLRGGAVSGEAGSGRPAFRSELLLEIEDGRISGVKGLILVENSGRPGPASPFLLSSPLLLEVGTEADGSWSMHAAAPCGLVAFPGDGPSSTGLRRTTLMLEALDVHLEREGASILPSRARIRSRLSFETGYGGVPLPQSANPAGCDPVSLCGLALRIAASTAESLHSAFTLGGRVPCPAIDLEAEYATREARLLEGSMHLVLRPTSNAFECAIRADGEGRRGTRLEATLEMEGALQARSGPAPCSATSISKAYLSVHGRLPLVLGTSVSFDLHGELDPADPADSPLRLAVKPVLAGSSSTGADGFDSVVTLATMGRGGRLLPLLERIGTLLPPPFMLTRRTAVSAGAPSVAVESAVGDRLSIGWRERDVLGGGLGLRLDLSRGTSLRMEGLDGGERSLSFTFSRSF